MEKLNRDKVKLQTINYLTRTNLVLTAVDDKVDSTIRDLAQAVLEENIKLREVLDRQHDEEGDLIEFILETRQGEEHVVTFDSRGDVNTLSIDGECWRQLAPEDIDCEWAEEQRASFEALSTLLVNIVANV